MGRLLSSRGIKVIGMDLAGDLMRFSVPAAQSSFTRYLLAHEGIPYTSSRQADSPVYKAPYGLRSQDLAADTQVASDSWEAPRERGQGSRSARTRTLPSFDAISRRLEDKLDDVVPGR